MKYVFNRADQVAHLWVHQIQEHARSTNASFDGKIFKSYATAIAQIHKRENNTIVLMNKHNYSMTTNKHKRIIRDACENVHEVLEVEIINPHNTAEHTQNYEYLIAQYNNCVGRTARSRKPWAFHSNITAANSFRRWIQQYSQFFSLAWDVPEEIIVDPTRANELQEKADAHFAAAKARRIEQEKERLEKWLTGENVASHFSSGTYLRILGDDIQTSRGARIPIEDAVRIWPLLKRIHETGKRWIPETAFKLGHYVISHFTNDELVVGCHHIPYSEIERMAGQLNLLAEAARAQQMYVGTTSSTVEMSSNGLKN